MSKKTRLLHQHRHFDLRPMVIALRFVNPDFKGRVFDSTALLNSMVTSAQAMDAAFKAMNAEVARVVASLAINLEQMLTMPCSNCNGVGLARPYVTPGGGVLEIRCDRCAGSGRVPWAEAQRPLTPTGGGTPLL